MSTPNTRRDFLRTVAGVGAGLAFTASSRSASTPATGNGAVGLRAPAMDRVRVGIIGLGARGGGHLGTLLTLDGVDIVALCDNHAPTLAKAFARVEKAQRPVPASTAKTITIGSGCWNAKTSTSSSSSHPGNSTRRWA